MWEHGSDPGTGRALFQEHLPTNFKVGARVTDFAVCHACPTYNHGEFAVLFYCSVVAIPNIPSHVPSLGLHLAEFSFLSAKRLELNSILSMGLGWHVLDIRQGRRKRFQKMETETLKTVQVVQRFTFLT